MATAAFARMYSTCLFCQHDLGRNETFERFHVGSRLAYDPAKGRLWVVCRRCARWNLTPLEERWEAIDEAERRFQGARRRASTGEIAMARLPEGTELVRIGKAPRLELAAWRYGDDFGRRRKRALILTGAGVAIGGAAIGGALAAGLSAVISLNGARWLLKMTKEGAAWTTVARLRLTSGELVRVTPRHLRRTRIDRTDEGGLVLQMYREHEDIEYGNRPIRFEDDVARKVLGKLLPAVNRMGGTRREVDEALARIDASGSADDFLAAFARRGARLTPVSKNTPDDRAHIVTRPDPERAGYGLFGLPRTLALAAEMVVNEERERRAMEGELALLEAAWREAEEIAQIADSL